MRKKFFKNLILLLVLNLLVKPFWILGVDRQVFNVVGTEDYGFYFTVFNFSMLFTVLLDLGINSFNNKNIAQNNKLLAKHLAGIGTLKIMLGVIYGLVVLFVGYIIGYRGYQMKLLALVAFNQVLLSFILYLRTNISGLLFFMVDSFLSVLDRFLMILIVGVLLWTGIAEGKFNIEWFVISQTVAYFVTFITALTVVLSHAGKLKFNWNPAFYILILKKSFPFALLALLMSFYNRIDPVLIERMLPHLEGDYQSGIYSAAFRLLDAGQNFAALFAVLLLPMFAKMIKEKQNIESLMNFSFSLIITAALIIAAVSLFYAERLMLLMYRQGEMETAVEFNSRIIESAKVFRVLMFSFVAISTNYIFGTLLTANNSLKLLNIIALGGMIINIVVNIVLIPHYKAYGSSFASLSSQLLTGGLNMIAAYYIFKIKPNVGLWLKIVLAFTVTAFISYWMNKNSGLSLLPSLSISLLSGIFISLILKLINPKEIILVLKSKE
jgi:O-antigen/teichoic acid export membrane protein